MTKEQDIQKLGRAISEELVTLGEEVKASGGELEASLAQLDQYQSTIASLRQSILACEGELRTVSSPAYTARDRDKALAEQSVRTITSYKSRLKSGTNYKMEKMQKIRTILPLFKCNEMRFEAKLF